MARGLALVAVLSWACVGLAGTAEPTAQLSDSLVRGTQPSDLFSRDEAVVLQLRAPLTDLFENARTDDAYTVTGTLSYSDGGHEVAVEGVRVSVRGHTSKRESECAFPKLKLGLPADVPAQGPLSGLTSLKIGTHCGDEPADALTIKYGRLANEQSPVREAFVYRLLDAAGVPTFKARAAKITYVLTNTGDGPSDAQRRQPFVRNAMLLEDTDAALKRLGAARELDVKAFSDARAVFSTADTARLAFAEAMIGNFDWCLKMFPGDRYRCDARNPLWNVVAAAAADGRAQPLIYDFDIAGMVVGRHTWFRNIFSEAFVASRSHAEIEVLAQVQRTRTLFGRADLDAARREFVKRKPHAYRALESTELDPVGRRHAHEYLDSFYNAMESDEAFYRPVVTAAGARIYADENGRLACPSRPEAPVGTPVSEPLQKKGSLIQVVVLDALWHWAPPVKCPAVREGPVWIDADAIGTDFPMK